MPRKNETKICKSQDSKCMENSEINLLKLRLEGQNECECLPTCKSLSYSGEISQSEYEIMPYLKAKNEIFGNNNSISK